jgi:hypothetical protein
VYSVFFDAPVGSALLWKGRQPSEEPLLPWIPPDQRDHREKKRNLPLGKSDQASFGTQSFGSQTPSPLLSSNVSLRGVSQGCAECLAYGKRGGGSHCAAIGPPPGWLSTSLSTTPTLCAWQRSGAWSQHVVWPHMPRSCRRGSCLALSWGHPSTCAKRGLRDPFPKCTTRAPSSEPQTSGCRIFLRPCLVPSISCRALCQCMSCLFCM